jgi:hypothetical protein
MQAWNNMKPIAATKYSGVDQTELTYMNVLRISVFIAWAKTGCNMNFLVAETITTEERRENPAEQSTSKVVWKMDLVSGCDWVESRSSAHKAARDHLGESIPRQWSSDFQHRRQDSSYVRIPQKKKRIIGSEKNEGPPRRIHCETVRKIRSSKQWLLKDKISTCKWWRRVAVFKYIFCHRLKKPSEVVLSVHRFSVMGKKN